MVMQVTESTEGVIYVASVYTSVYGVYTLLEALLAQIGLQRLWREAESSSSDGGGGRF